MATLVLQAAGAAVGSIFGPFGAIAGRALGALAGYAIDQSLFGEKRTREGARLADLGVQGSREGAAIPRVYGRVRISGQVIWATRFEEETSETREGGKGGGGGTTVRTYSYFASFAIGLCEGPVARIGRVWADGKPFDLSAVTHRFYPGDETQAVDSLIEAKQGEAPAYRNTAVIVFERLPLADFGNRLPQLSFEVIRPVAGVENDIRAVTLIPGSTEFGYDPAPVWKAIAPGNRVPANRHADGARTDWEASLDELTAVCSKLERVALVVTWFGDDLRCGECTLMPAVTDRTSVTEPYAWRVAGLTRADARLVSTFEDRPAYGGTPTDASVIRAIQDLAARGVKVTFLPFAMMDIPAGNGLPDPYGGAEQPAHPWRGEITLSVAPGEVGTPDKTAAAADEVAAFAGTAAAGYFGASGGAVTYSGPAEWRYRRFVLHYAKLCQLAGGVDAFLIGSELRGLTTVRDGASSYPFVAELVDLAAEVRLILGSGTKISYAADWSEYFGHQPADGSGDVFFHLDPLWADANIDFVGIDNYLPLADWRDGTSHADAEDWESGRDRAYFRANIAGGERFDWYYASDADRDAQMRTPITDGYGKPWVFRVKDLAGWWGNLHYDRPGGVEAETPTAWAPAGKPIWFTELGCPAVDKGANQPNVFPDPKSSAGGLPYYSTGARDDLVQQRFIEAHLNWWDPDAAGFDDAANPVSPLYGGRMVDPSAIHLWTWDARPFPMFPLKTDVWSDGTNWETGHWLTGRLGAPGTEALVRQILADYGVADIAEVGDLDGTVDGFLIDRVMSARGALEPLSQLLMFEAFESGDRLRFVRRGRRARQAFGRDDLVEAGERPLIAIRRAQETELPAEIGIGFTDALADYRPTSVNSRRLVGGSRRSEATETGVVMSHAVAGGLADTALQDIWAGRETAMLSLPLRTLALEPADICTLDLDGDTRTLMVTRIEDAGSRRIEARTIEPDILAVVPAAVRALAPAAAPALSRPEAMLLDLPLLAGAEHPHAPRIAVFAEPWPGAIAVAIGTPASGFLPRQAIERRATMGELLSPLSPGPVARIDRANAIDVRLYGGALASEPPLAVLNGANAAAIGSAGAGYEVVQFETAELIAPGTWRLSGLLRGQGGTADIMAAGHDAGARFVLLDRAVVPLVISESESGLALTVRCGAAGAVYDPDVFVDVPLIAGRRGLKPLAPVHLRAARAAGGDVTLRWVRQTRTGGDTWEPVEVPLGEAAEAYRVTVLDGAATVRTFDVATPVAVYAAADQVADFGSLPAAIAFAVAQMSATEGAGVEARRTVAVG
jgi:hypothetical protein